MITLILYLIVIYLIAIGVEMDIIVKNENKFTDIYFIILAPLIIPILIGVTLQKIFKYLTIKENERNKTNL